MVEFTLSEKTGDAEEKAPTNMQVSTNEQPRLSSALKQQTNGEK
jgi:hypothetical protein